MLQRLRSIENGVVSLRGDRDRIIERHAKIERSMAELAAAQRRLQQERAQKRLAQQAAANRLRVVEAEVRLLNEEQAQLARGFPRDEAAMVARAEPQAGRAPAYPGGMRGTSGRGAAVDHAARPLAPRPWAAAGSARTGVRWRGPRRAAQGCGRAGRRSSRVWRAAGHALHDRRCAANSSQRGRA